MVEINLDFPEPVGGIIQNVMMNVQYNVVMAIGIEVLGHSKVADLVDMIVDGYVRNIVEDQPRYTDKLENHNDIINELIQTLNKMRLE